MGVFISWKYLDIVLIAGKLSRGTSSTLRVIVIIMIVGLDSDGRISNHHQSRKSRRYSRISANSLRNNDILEY